MDPVVWEVTGDTWRDVVESIPDGVVLVDTSGVKRFANRALCEMLGFSPSELLGETIPFSYWPEDQHAVLTAGFEAALSGSCRKFESVLRRKSGEPFDVLVRPALVRSQNVALGTVATITDISERRRLDRELYASKERWRSVAENPFDFVITLDRNYAFTYVNHPAPGIQADEIIGKATPFEFVEPQYHAAMRQVFERAFHFGEPGSYEVYVPMLETWLYNFVGPIFESGVVTGISVLTRDITAQKHAEQALRQSQRMEALGRLAGGIAHDFNNLLVPILGNASLLEQSVAPGSDERILLEDIVRASERAKELVSRVLVFGREASERRQPVLVQDIAREVAGFIRAGANAELDIVEDIDPACPPVDGVPGEVHQIIANLCTNAVQALKGPNGRLKLVVAKAVLTTDGLAAKSGASGTLERHTASRSAVLISVEDTGTGIEPSVQSRIFDPFFTTHAVGEGTGLGLSIVQAIASRYGGKVSFTSSPGVGTRFDVLLPALATASQVECPKPPESQATAPGAVGMIVCIDDEPLVLRLLTRVLERAGHSVQSISDAQVAARYIEAHASAIDCVITDERMPTLKGSELAQRVAEYAPAVPFLLLSGYPAHIPESLPKNVQDCIQKPVDVAFLLKTLGEIISERRGAPLTR